MAEQLLAVPNQTPYDLRFKLFGVSTRTHPLFWLMAALIGHSFAGDDLLRIVIAAVCVFLSILVHEFGHALSGRWFGDRLNYVVIYLMGGLCVPGITLRHWPRIAMIFWGPLAGFLLAGVAFGLNYALNRQWIPIQAKEVFFAIDVLFGVNIFWSIFNLLPVFPLDGGQILREGLMWKKPRGGEALAFLISMISAILTTIGAVAYCAINKLPPPIMVMVMMLYFAFQSWQMRQMVLAYGLSAGEVEEPRAAWEQDPDWWKKG